MISSFAELIERARQLGPARIAVVEAHDPDVLESLGQAEPLGLATPILVGTPSKIEASAKKVGYALKPDAIVPTTGEEASVRQAIDLVREGKADFLMKGKVTTATLIRGIVDRERGRRVLVDRPEPGGDVLVAPLHDLAELAPAAGFVLERVVVDREDVAVLVHGQILEQRHVRTSW